MKTSSRYGMVLVAAFCCSLSSVSVVIANNSDGYTIDFESPDFAVGVAISNYPGWFAETPDSIIVATNFTSRFIGEGYPLVYSRESNQALRFEGGVTKIVDAGDNNVTNWVDMILQPVLADDPPSLSDVDGGFAAMYFNTNKNLVVYYSPAYDTFDWVEVEMPENWMEEGDWIRVTIAANLADGNNMDDFSRFYKVYINDTLITSDAAFTETSGFSDTGGHWFSGGRGAKITRSAPITNLTINGTGHLDDVVFSNQDVFGDDPPGTTELTIGGTFTAFSRVYDGTTEATINDDNLTLVGETGEDDVTLASVTLAFAQAGVGTDIDVTITGATLGGDDFENYTLSLTGAPTAEADITPAQLTVTADPQSKDYDGDVFPVGEYTVFFDGFIEGEDEGDLGGELSFSGPAIAAVNAGAYDIVPEGLTSTNYDITFVEGELTIHQIPLTITANSFEKIEGELHEFTGNEFTMMPETLVGSDTVTSVTLESAGAAASASTGTYAIVASDAQGTGLDNYDITYVNGLLTVVAADPGDGPSPEWLGEFGWTEEDLDEPRAPGDTMTRRMAWLASVDPTDTNAVFRINRVWTESNMTHIEWLSTYVDDSLPPFVIWARTNLMDTTETFVPVDTVTRQSVQGQPSADVVTNIWAVGMLEYPVYYRIHATNTVVVID